LEVVQLSPTVKQHVIKSTGFSFDSTYYDFPKGSDKSFVMIDPFSESNGYVTQSEERYNRTRDAFEYIWKNLTNNDTLNV
jgi:23S rRNA A2030 N6-methylase RlmJ